MAFAASAALAGIAAAQDQYIQFEPLAYRGSPEGEPLKGQDGWYLPGGVSGGGDWLVYTFDGGSLGLPTSTSGGSQFAAVTTLGDVPASIERASRFDWTLTFTADVLVEHRGPLPAPEEIGRISLEPAGLSSTFELAIRWEDPATTEGWILDIVYYTAGGERRQAPFTAVLRPGRWYEIVIRADFGSNSVQSGWVGERSTGATRGGFTASDWYLAGGASSLGFPSGVRLTAGDGTDEGALVAVDNIFTGQLYCYWDCDRDGAPTIFDFLCFQTLFALGDPYADCDGSGIIEFFDFLCFQDDIAHGCGP